MLRCRFRCHLQAGTCPAKLFSLLWWHHSAFEKGGRCTSCLRWPDSWEDLGEGIFTFEGIESAQEAGGAKGLGAIDLPCELSP